MRNSLPGIASIFLEREAEQRDLLVGNGVKQSFDDTIRKATFLVFIYVDDLKKNNQTRTCHKNSQRENITKTG